MTNEAKVRAFLASNPHATMNDVEKFTDTLPSAAHTGIVRGEIESALDAVPFSKEIGAAINAPFHVAATGGKEGLAQSYHEGLDAANASLGDYRHEHPIASGVTELGTALPLMAALPGGVFGSSALAGGLYSASNAADKEESLGGIAKKGAEGAGIGLLTAGVSKLMPAAKITVPALGALAGAVVAGPGVGSRTMGGVVGGLTGVAAYKTGGAALEKLGNVVSSSDILRRLAPALGRVAPGMSKVATALEQEPSGPAGAIQGVANVAPGYLHDPIVAEAGEKGGVFRGLTEATTQYPGQGVAGLKRQLVDMSETAPSAADKSAAKALGPSSYQERIPVKDAARSALRDMTDPAFAKIKGAQVDNAVLKQAVNDSPEVAKILGQALGLNGMLLQNGSNAAEPVAKGFMLGDRVPLRVIENMRQIVNRDVNGAKNVPGVEGMATPAVQSKVYEIVNAAKQELPDYADALKVYGETKQAIRGQLSSRKELATSALGNSRTAARALMTRSIAEDASGPVLPGGLTRPGSMMRGMFNEGLSGQDWEHEQGLANDIASILGRKLSSQGEKDAFQKEVEDALATIAARKSAARVGPRLLGAGAGAGVGNN